MFDKLNAVEARYEQMLAAMADPALHADQAAYRAHARTLAELEPLVERFREYRTVATEIAQTEELTRGDDPEMRDLAAQELKSLEARRDTLLGESKQLLVPKIPALPREIIFKTSAHLGQCNPCSFKLLESLGADSINPVRDLQIPMIAALRQAVKAPLDIHTDNPPGSGGFIRAYEAPEIVRVAAPLHCKTGNSVVSAHGEMTSPADGKKMADQATIIVEMINKYYPLTQSAKGSEDLRIPCI